MTHEMDGQMVILGLAMANDIQMDDRMVILGLAMANNIQMDDWVGIRWINVLMV